MPAQRARRRFTHPSHRCSVCGKGCHTAGSLKQHQVVHESLPTQSARPATRSERNELQEDFDNALGDMMSEARASPSPSATPPQSRSPSPVQAVPISRQGTVIQRHPIIDGAPCDAEGYELPPGSPPPPLPEQDPDDYTPFRDQVEFEFADFLYTDVEMPGKKVSRLAELLAAMYQQDPPFANHDDLLDTIDAIPHGDVPWETFSVKYNGPFPQKGATPSWMLETYEVWFRSPLAVFERQIGNPDFKDEIDWAPKRVYKDGKRQYMDFFSGNWVWEQADEIAKDEELHGAAFVPAIVGSDKTTTSVGTGNTEFYPYYGGIGNTFNSTRRAHRDGIALLGFLAIPKTTRQYAGSNEFRKFRRQLFHASLRRILEPIRPYMTTPKVTRCGDGHFRRIIYGVGPYIADYPEQALLTCIVQGCCPRCSAPPDDLDRPSPRRSREETEALLDGCTLKELWDGFGIVGDIIPFTADLPRADIHELISMDLLHQIIKGTFKDHIVDWVEQYIYATHESKAAAERVLADIDRRIALVPSFPGLRRFPTGRGFKQWTGNDSKALMKVYLPAIAGHVPDQVVHAVSALLEFTYLVRRSVIDEDCLLAIGQAVERFHQAREIFRLVRPDGFSLPRQHSMVHYVELIIAFGAPNGLCSSITESKHIKAVKRPWRRSSRNKPLAQMLLTNQRLDKLRAARIHFKDRGMLGSLFPLAEAEEELVAGPAPDGGDGDGDGEGEGKDDDGGDVEGPTCLGEVKLAKKPARRVPRNIHELAIHVEQPRLHELVRRFLFDQLNPDSELDGMEIPLELCPAFEGRVYKYNSARAIFYAPSDVCGVGGMHHERIRAVESWYGGGPRYDTIFLEHDPDAPGFQGLHVARVRLLFQFKHLGVSYPCALIHWFSTVGDEPCDVTGLWAVEPDYIAVRGGKDEPLLAVVHLDTILRGSHLIGRAGREFLPEMDFEFHESLDRFNSFYVNKYADHHSHEIAF
ncbi:hypothetical protein C8F01DRAFT_1366212 [Mycena amicta]|nr:hypothetical protein C8F01DRAFT_1366212 [Mycena amicta]